MNKVTIKNNPEISAIYYALLQNGYEYYAFERDSALLAVIDSFKHADNRNAFFAQVRQNTCEAYPYWPRAAILETAVFSQGSGELRRKIVSAANTKNEERGEVLWEWLAAFPNALNSTLYDTEFKRYLKWETGWVANENCKFSEELASLGKYLDICKKNYGTDIDDVEIIVNPIKCAYSCDYHIVGKRLICTMGRFEISFVLHEYLHHIIHPYAIRLKERVLMKERTYPNLDDSYYLSGDAEGMLNAYEEHAVRCLTEALINGEVPEDLNGFLEDIIGE